MLDRADVVRNVTLVCTTGIAGACWAVVMVSSFGMYKRTKGTLWAHCDIEIFVSWMSVGLLSNAGFIRIYRHWKLLHKHDRKMWPTEVSGVHAVFVSPEQRRLARESRPVVLKQFVWCMIYNLLFGLRQRSSCASIRCSSCTSVSLKFTYLAKVHHERPQATILPGG